ncbi:MAG: hypothetical protein WBQ09_05685 [Terriglobales bacterium]
MKRSLITCSLITALVALVCISLTGIGFAQDPSGARPMFKALPPHNYYPNVKPADPAVQLPQWTFTWTSSYDGRQFSTVIVGSDPRSTNTTTTVTVGVIPIKMVYGASNGNMTFDPSTPYFENYSTTQMVMDSPIFKSEFDYNQGGTDLGKTQYEDAYQRGNFWGAVKTNTDYHLILKTVLGPEQTFTVPAGEGDVINNPWSGIPTGTADINWFDEQLQTVITKYKQINPSVLPLFITENVYLTEGGCCIGGYHSANGPAPAGQTYSYSTSIQQAGVPVFSQDVGALAHEVGEWIMDPFTENASPCPSNSILEVGDPLENGPNFGDYPYTIDGFTFHPQDLVFITWFGAPPATSLDVWNGVTTNVVTFQNEKLAVCQTI